MLKVKKVQIICISLPSTLRKQCLYNFPVGTFDVEIFLRFSTLFFDVEISTLNRRQNFKFDIDISMGFYLASKKRWKIDVKISTCPLGYYVINSANRLLQFLIGFFYTNFTHAMSHTNSSKCDSTSGTKIAICLKKRLGNEAMDRNKQLK